MVDTSASGRFIQIRSGLANVINRANSADGHGGFRRGLSVANRFGRYVTVTREAIENLTPARTSSAGSLLLRSGIALVIVPTLIFFLYAACWESNGYVSEARITVRGPPEQRSSTNDAASMMARMTGGAANTTVRDSFIVLNYIKSSAVIVDLGGRPYLEKYFSGAEIDFFSRLGREESIEDLLKFWLKHVAVSIDTISGILTIKVDAYQPSGAQQIAQDIVAVSERLVNTMTLRSRSDALDRARQEVFTSADNLAGARDRLTKFREQSAIIDPASRAQSVGELIGKLTMDKIGIESAFETVQGSLNVDSPTQRIQRARLTAINQQIDNLKKSLTDARDATAVSSQIASYERLKLDEQFNQLMYTVSQASYEKARQELDKQQLYLIVIVPPMPPESATFPKVFASSALLFGSLFLAWAIVSLIAASVHDQMT